MMWWSKAEVHTYIQTEEANYRTKVLEQDNIWIHTNQEEYGYQYSGRSMKSAFDEIRERIVSRDSYYVSSLSTISDFGTITQS